MYEQKAGVIIIRRVVIFMICLQIKSFLTTTASAAQTTGYANVSVVHNRYWPLQKQMTV